MTTSSQRTHPPKITAQNDRSEAEEWLEAFQEGDREVIEDIYRQHYGSVDRAIGTMLSAADKETLIHEVFFAVISQKRVRMGFRGGSIRAWLCSVAKNRATDFLRHQRCVQNVDHQVATGLVSNIPVPDEARTDARRMIADFSKEHLPDKWQPVFDARFIRQMTQREAASALAASRTTLAYREQQIRRRLRRYLLEKGER
jgi:RNA polymerase sigma-70 factor (ECF subfamily)